MNEHSSRSHTIFSLIIESKPAEGVITDDCVIRRAVLNLVDLAGSERIASTGAVGARKKEAGSINKSLMTLGLVINEITSSNGKGFVPYRSSKLTQILKSALGGDTKTAIICCATLATRFIDETTSTLQFASRAKEIKNKPIVNQFLDKDAYRAQELLQYKQEIEILKAKLLQMQSVNDEKNHLEQTLRREIKFREEETVNLERTLALKSSSDDRGQKSKFTFLDSDDSLEEIESADMDKVRQRRRNIEDPESFVTQILSAEDMRMVHEKFRAEAKKVSGLSEQLKTVQEWGNGIYEQLKQAEEELSSYKKRDRESANDDEIVYTEAKYQCVECKKYRERRKLRAARLDEFVALEKLAKFQAGVHPQPKDGAPAGRESASSVAISPEEFDDLRAQLEALKQSNAFMKSEADEFKVQSDAARQEAEELAQREQSALRDVKELKEQLKNLLFVYEQKEKECDELKTNGEQREQAVVTKAREDVVASDSRIKELEEAVTAITKELELSKEALGRSEKDAGKAKSALEKAKENESDFKKLLETQSTSINMLEQEVSSLKRLNAELESQRQRPEDVKRCDDLQREVEQLKQDVARGAENARRVAELQMQNETSAKRIGELEERLKLSNEELERKTEENKASWLRYNSIRDELKKAKKEPKADAVMQKERDSMEKEMGKLQAQLSEAKEKLRKATQEKSTYSTEKLQLEKQLKDSQWRVELLEKDCEKLRGTASYNKESATQMSNLRKEKETLSKNLAAVNDQMAALREAKAEADATVKKLTADLEAAAGEVQQAKATAAEKEKLVESLTASSTTAEQELRKLIDEKGAECQELAEKLKKAESDKSSVRDDFEKRMVELEATVNQVKVLEDEKGQLEAKLKEAESALKEKESELQDEKKSIVENDEVWSRKMQRSESLNQERMRLLEESAQKRIAESENNAQVANSDFNALQQQFNTVFDEKRELSDKLDELQRRLDAAGTQDGAAATSGELEQLGARVTEMEAELLASHEENARLTKAVSNFKETRAKKRELELRVQELHADLTEHNTVLLDQTRLIDEKDAELAALREENGALKDENAQLRQRVLSTGGGARRSVMRRTVFHDDPMAMDVSRASIAMDG